MTLLESLAQCRLRRQKSGPEAGTPADAGDLNVLSYDRFQRNSAKITSYCRNNKSKSLPTAIKNLGLW